MIATALFWRTPSFQLTLTQDEDDEESFRPVAEEQERKISEAIAIKIRNFDCKCYGRRKETFSLWTQSCSCKLSPELMYNIRMLQHISNKLLQFFLDFHNFDIIGRFRLHSFRI
ncbi:hypothetical protein XENOCAPTIV_006303 [Xenoophorus captivus]|uniref:Uncharacterized protein n=1 Tax=Xenoophorus captivus TaxID=1517983 RepID=A0ABV0S7Y6_9TELE